MVKYDRFGNEKGSESYFYLKNSQLAVKTASTQSAPTDFGSVAVNSIRRGYSGVQVNALSSTMSRLPDLSLSPICWVSATPAAIVAPQPGLVARLAYTAGAAFLAVRPSLRSFSRWVCVVYFASATVAESFACACATRFGFPFCRVRSLGSWWGVSVPVCVCQWFCVAGSLPYLVVSLMAGEQLTTHE